MVCDRCRAGEMLEYEKEVGKTKLRGTKCSVCGFVVLENDDDIWNAVGL